MTKGSPLLKPRFLKPDTWKAVIKLRRALVKAWCRDTCFYKAIYDGTGRGQCYATAMLVQQLFGGHVVNGYVDHINHYWNKLPDGVEIDLTSDQFGGNGIHPVARRIVMNPKRKPNRRCKRYLLLRERFEKTLKEKIVKDLNT